MRDVERRGGEGVGRGVERVRRGNGVGECQVDVWCYDCNYR